MKGLVYVVRDIRQAEDFTIIFDLVGVPEPVCHGPRTGFNMRRFKPLEKAKREAYYNEFLEATGYPHPDTDPEHKFLRPSDLTGPGEEEEEE